MSEKKYHEKIQEFVQELGGFAKTAEETLSAIEQDMMGKKNLFAVFSEKMFAIRGSAQQLELENIAKIAGLGEEIAVKGAAAESRAHVRKCVGALWDALTTVKYMLEHYQEETSEEQGILENRLQATLKAFGGARPTVNDDEIMALLKQRG